MSQVKYGKMDTYIFKSRIEYANSGYEGINRLSACKQTRHTVPKYCTISISDFICSSEKVRKFWPLIPKTIYFNNVFSFTMYFPNGEASHKIVLRVF